MKENKGFSLIEIIVVIAMMGILIGVGMQVFGLVENGYVKSGANEIASILKKAEYNAQAVAAKEWVMEIKRSGDTYTAALNKITLDNSGNEVSTEVDSKTLEGKVDIKFTGKFKINPLIDIVIADGDTLSFTFDKESGEVISVKLVSSTVGTKEYTGSGLDASAGSENMGTLTISSRNHKKKIDIYWSTGKIFMS